MDDARFPGPDRPQKAKSSALFHCETCTINSDDAFLIALTKRYKKGVIAVDSASFTVEQGAAFGLLGPIGSGKSSIIHMLLNFTKPTAGSIKLFDRDIATDFHEVQSKIGYVPERPGFYGNFSAEKNHRIFANLYGVPG